MFHMWSLPNKIWFSEYKDKFWTLFESKDTFFGMYSNYIFFGYWGENGQ